MAKEFSTAVKSPAILPYKDVTIKARISNSDRVEELIQLMKAHFVGTDFQTDHYFETTIGKLKWRKARIENLITHYERFLESGLERTLVYRYDLNPSQAQIDELLQQHKPIGITQKQRKIYQVDNVKIHLDQLPNEEEFIEIEAIDRDSRYTIEELKNQCLQVLANLEISTSDLIPTGYLSTNPNA